MLQIGAASLLQIGTSVFTNWGSSYKSGQPLLQNRAAITNWGRIYYKLGQVLQMRAIITNWGITMPSWWSSKDIETKLRSACFYYNFYKITKKGPKLVSLPHFLRDF